MPAADDAVPLADDDDVDVVGALIFWCVTASVLIAVIFFVFDWLRYVLHRTARIFFTAMVALAYMALAVLAYAAIRQLEKRAQHDIDLDYLFAFACDPTQYGGAWTRTLWYFDIAKSYVSRFIINKL